MDRQGWPTVGAAGRRRWVFYGPAGDMVREVVPDEVPTGLLPVGWPAPLAALFAAPDRAGFYLAMWAIPRESPRS